MEGEVKSTSDWNRVQIDYVTLPDATAIEIRARRLGGYGPVIRGTRIMVKNILGMVAGGYAVDRILCAYPELTREMVQAALEYAAAVIDEEQVIARA